MIAGHIGATDLHGFTRIRRKKHRS